jgi:hypothetical protein
MIFILLSRSRYSRVRRQFGVMVPSSRITQLLLELGA